MSQLKINWLPEILSELLPFDSVGENSTAAFAGQLLLAEQPA